MLTPNLGKPIRIAYAAIGLVLLAAPLLFSMAPWMQIGIPILGFLTLATGATGW